MPTPRAPSICLMSAYAFVLPHWSAAMTSSTVRYSGNAMAAQTQA